MMGGTGAGGAVDGGVGPGGVGVTVAVPVGVGTTTGIVTVDGGEVTGGPDGGSPDTVAESLTLPLSMSAWVTV